MLVQEITFMNHQGNSGPEGIAFDEVNGLFYVAKEKNPMVIYHFSLASIYGDTSIVPEVSFNAEMALSDEIDDISGLLFDQRTQRLLVLSEDSNKILDIALPTLSHKNLEVSWSLFLVFQAQIHNESP